MYFEAKTDETILTDIIKSYKTKFRFIFLKISLNLANL